ncbi:TetR/AcrR family transcriptional regulator [Luteimonas sp. SJ-92]|uniref:TetR/AcrR family transcriptional regulator n=1 Tax=Luteimonas salinisoli TaxID=2752307 RepID=A0A853JAP9_9GAMM|nr:TetR/AcrR family transcriptional regulator [Luteimonas salinisoli]NZA26273.1 TetR/AcrR family transcriptional regulator [Luteimonas salinisoli]
MDSTPKKPARRARHGAARRAPGRPAGEAPDLRERLLDAALACYVRRGIAGTSARDIAAEADVTPALLHYYFGDAARLREAVIEQRLLPVFAGVRARVAEAAGEDLATLVAGFVDAVCRGVEAHPWFPALWVREVVSEGGALRDLLVTRVAPEMAHLLAARFAQAQAAGRLNADLDPRLLMVSLVGLTLFPAAGAPIWRQLFDADDLGMDDVRRHALALLDRGLELGNGE